MYFMFWSILFRNVNRQSYHEVENTFYHWPPTIVQDVEPDLGPMCPYKSTLLSVTRDVNTVYVKRHTYNLKLHFSLFVFWSLTIPRLRPLDPGTRELTPPVGPNVEKRVPGVMTLEKKTETSGVGVHYLCTPTTFVSLSSLSLSGCGVTQSLTSPLRPSFTSFSVPSLLNETSFLPLLKPRILY